MTTAGRRANVIGCGLIGGSVGLALRAAGWRVSGSDLDADRADRAKALGCIDSVGLDAEAVLTFVCTSVYAVAAAAAEALAATEAVGGVVSDVGSVKAAVVASVDSSRFVGGHPMAGSEQEGVEGADAELFEGATWVLTPVDATDSAAFALVRATVASFGADAIAVAPDRHDELVALVSHVPHLTAAALMGLADTAASEHTTLLRLAAGGFRDMTRIAAGHPEIWLDICESNSAAITATLDDLIGSLEKLRSVVGSNDRVGLLDTLTRARAARVNLPARAAGRPDDVVEMRIPVPDRTGVLAEVTTLLGELSVNIADLEIAHSAEGTRGVLLLLIDAAQADLARGALLARGYRPSIQRLT